MDTPNCPEAVNLSLSACHYVARPSFPCLVLRAARPDILSHLCWGGTVVEHSCLVGIEQMRQRRCQWIDLPV